VTSSGRPIIGRVLNRYLGDEVTDEEAPDGVYIGVGHGAWGISHSLGTGLVLTELLEGRKTSADISQLGVH
jgi:glycine/D-amino acid oxidase-like deaminating enzyme